MSYTQNSLSNVICEDTGTVMYLKLNNITLFARCERSEKSVKHQSFVSCPNMYNLCVQMNNSNCILGTSLKHKNTITRFEMYCSMPVYIFLN